MKKTILISLSSLILIVLCDKNISGSARLANAKISSSIQLLTPPHFPGGEDAFHLYLSKNIKWPSQDYDVQGSVVISFFVEKDGTLTDFQVVKSMGKSFDDEALRVISNMPKWVPALRDKKPIKSKYSVPIKFFVNGG